MSRFKTSSSDRVNFPVVLAGGAILAVVVFLLFGLAGRSGSADAIRELQERLARMEHRLAAVEERSRRVDAMGETLGVFSDDFHRLQAMPAEMEEVKNKTAFLETRQANLERRLAEDGGSASETASARPPRAEVKTPRIEKTRPGRPSSAASPAPPAAGNGKTHVVRDGETLYSIAQRHDVSVERILEWNGLAKTDIIRPGQTLKIGE